MKHIASDRALFVFSAALLLAARAEMDRADRRLHVRT